VIGGPDCAHITALLRVWERWRRLARGLIVVARHVALYVIGCVRLHLVRSPMTRGNGAPARRRVTAAERARAAIDELGPTAIKLGQIRSTRDDVLPPDWPHELTRLQDAAPLVPPAAIRAEIVEEPRPSAARVVRGVRRCPARVRVDRTGARSEADGGH